VARLAKRRLLCKVRPAVPRPHRKAAYQELIRAWLLLADSAEQLARLRQSSASVRTPDAIAPSAVVRVRAVDWD
jgi:hypothetical protein